MRGSLPNSVKSKPLSEAEAALLSRTSSARLRNSNVHRTYLVPVLAKALTIVRVRTLGSLQALS